MRQTTLDELGTPLSEVTFCVVDLETTGASPATSAITEIGALKVCRGERVGTFHTLIDPGQPVPAFIRLLTGITDELLLEAPAIEAVLPSFLEFARDSVLVAHNARFDVSFLNAALTRAGYERLANPVLDTALLARKIIAGEVPNNRLATLAGYLRCAHQPCHRAFQDVLATTDVLHHLIERVAGFGVTTLEDLRSMSSTRMDGTFHKISLAEGLPDKCGVYRFVGASGNTLYVGKAANIRARVRSYFYGDSRRKIRDLLREAQAVRAQVCATTLEAEIQEARAIQQELPPYNRAGKGTATWYVKVAVARRGAGKVSATRTPRDDGAVYLGPFRALKDARTLIDALRDAAAIHRCSTPQSCRGCAFSQLGRCAGEDRAAHAEIVQRLANALEHDPAPIFDVLETKMRRLAGAGRFEEAAEVRDRAATLARALAKADNARSLVAAGDLVIRIGTRAVLIRDAQLAAATELDGDISARLLDVAVSEPVGSFFAPSVLAEATVIASWLRRHAAEVTLLQVSGTFASRAGARPDRFAPREQSDQTDPDTLMSRSRAAAAAPESIAS